MMINLVPGVGRIKTKDDTEDKSDRGENDEGEGVV